MVGRKSGTYICSTYILIFIKDIIFKFLNKKYSFKNIFQAKPMLNFQTDYDEATGEQVLTCFLLPQMEYQAEQMGKLSKKISVVLFYFCQPIACPPFFLF